MIELRRLQYVQDRAATASFGIHASHDHLRDAGLNDGAGAHLAGFQSHIERAVLQPPVTDYPAGFVDGGNLGVSQRTLIGIAAVIATPDHFSLVDDDAADGHFA